jgi:hypothetical protein
MEMRYGGGGCYNTNFRRCPLRNPDLTPEFPNPDSCSCTKEELPCAEWNNKNTCEDFNGGGAVCNDINQVCSNQASKDPTPGCGPPSAFTNHTVYIEAFGKDELYFAGPVQVNTTWEATTAGDKVEADTDIFTYEWIEGTGKGRLLQHVVFHSSCSQELYLTDQFGAQQLLEFDSFCDVSCSDPGCKEVTGPNGVRFGRRRISLFQDEIASLELSLGATSLDTQRIRLDQVLGLYQDSLYTTPSQLVNFTSVIGKIVPPEVKLIPENLSISPDKNYTIAAIVTGFLEDDPTAPCQQVSQTELSCQKVRVLPCDCPPCLGSGDGGGGDKKHKDKKKA